MTRVRKIMLELFVLALLVATTALSLGQLTVRASESVCQGLACTEQEDCGSKCFCNRPSKLCYLDDGEIE